MKILILEDNNEKLEDLLSEIVKINSEIQYKITTLFHDFSVELNRNKYDLVIADLKVKLFHDSTDDNDISDRLLECIRDIECINFKTPVIAVTKFDQLAEDNFISLNRCDINVITYNEESDKWKEPFINKIQSCTPNKSYKFVIVCALESEAAAYSEAKYKVGKQFIEHGIKCRTLQIDEHEGLIITPPRMGLVNSAILSARAIDLFKPKIICMSGICAGIEGKANIYDVIIPETCNQHDSGKWTVNGFIHELYDAPLSHVTKITIETIINEIDFKSTLEEGVSLKKNEFPIDCESLNFKVYLAPTSSGSAVVADDETLENIKDQHRKKTAFEMETYALYEAARQSLESPIFFSAKSVVDNGNSQKGDQFHRVASLLSAKAVYEIIKRKVTIL